MSHPKLKKPGAVFTDQTWTGYVGETVPEEFTRIFNIVREARDAAVEFVRKNVRAGKFVRGAEIDDVSRGVIQRAGYGEQFTHRTGHSIGEEGHGNGVNIDNFETRDSRRLIPGIAFSIEPGIYLEGKFGVRSEIDVYVAEKDIEVTGQPIQTDIVPILKTAVTTESCHSEPRRRRGTPHLQVTPTPAGRHALHLRGPSARFASLRMTTLEAPSGFVAVTAREALCTSMTTELSLAALYKFRAAS